MAFQRGQEPHFTTKQCVKRHVPLSAPHARVSDQKIFPKHYFRLHLLEVSFKTVLESSINVRWSWTKREAVAHLLNWRCQHVGQLAGDQNSGLSFLYKVPSGIGGFQ